MGMIGCRLVAVLLCCGLALSDALAEVPLDGTRAATGLNQRVNSGAHVVLTGGGWTTTSRIVRFVWRQVRGPRVHLRDANRSTASFYAPSVKTTTVLKFRLTVTDVRGGSGSGVVDVTVEPADKPIARETPSHAAQDQAGRQ